MNLKINRPEPIVSDVDLILFKKRTEVISTIKQLVDGYYVLITGTYSNGIDLIHEVHKYLKIEFAKDSFKEQRNFRAEFQKISKQILIEIVDHKLKVKKSPEIGWLEKLYPEQDRFLLPFTQIQGLNSAWQWYIKGINLPVLRNKIHPYYGVYFPTRFEHLILFDNWLKRYEGSKKSAFDIGVGCGVLSLQMVKHGFQKVFATDTNSNAIFGLNEAIEGTKNGRKIELEHANLFGSREKPSELIVFNPPWLPTSTKLGRLDEAIYYPKGLFPEFFEEAKKRLTSEGKLVVLFSNLAQITEVTKEHPIEKELAKGNRFKLNSKFTKSVKSASSKTTRDQNWRAEETIELWVLEHI